jgi:hypothetical protein
MVIISWWCGGGHEVKGAAASAGLRSGTLELGDGSARHWCLACAAVPAGQALSGKLTTSDPRGSSPSRQRPHRPRNLTFGRAHFARDHDRPSSGRRARVAGSSSPIGNVSAMATADLRQPGSDEPVATRPAGWRCPRAPRGLLRLCAPGLCRLEIGPLGQHTLGDIPPQGDQQLTRDGNDRDHPHPAAPVTDPLTKPSA